MRASRQTRRVLAGATVLAAAAPGARVGAQALQFRHVGVDDGLPSSLVSDIVRDRRGVMWLGTGHGVTRYDGHRFRTYAHDGHDATSLPGGVVAQVYEDREGTLWAVTPGGLSYYDPAHDRFITYPPPVTPDRPAGAVAATITSVVEDARGTLWVGTSAGLYTVDRRTGVATPHALPRADFRTSAYPYIVTLYRDRAARVWVGTRSGLYAIAPGSGGSGDTTRHFAYDPADARALPDSNIRALAEDAAGTLWVGTGDGGLARFDARTGHFVRYRHKSADPHSLAKDRIVRLAPDRTGAGIGLWVGTENGGLDRLDVATGRFAHHQFDPNVPSGIGSNSIWSLYQDATGVLWVGTFTGGLDISAPSRRAIQHYHAIAGDSTSLSYNAVPSFGDDRAGHVWVATDGGGLNRFDPATGQFTRYTPHNTNLNAEAVLGVVEDHRGELWVATWGGGISHFDRATRSFRPYATANSDIPSNNVYEILEDHAGQLWIGTDNGMVARFDRARGAFTRRYTVVPPGLEPSSVLLVRELADGRFAIGLREGGVAVLDPATGARRHYLAGGAAGRAGARGLASNSVRALLDGGPGVLWVGTEDGLDRLSLGTGRAVHYGRADGLPSDVVLGLVTDRAGRLWVSTDRGLGRFDPVRRTFARFERSDGLQGSEFLMRSAFRGRDGTLYFGGNNGFNAIHPERVVEHPRAPDVALTGLQLFNRPVVVGAPGSPLTRAIGETRTLTLTAAQNVVTFEFAAPDYAVPEKTRYAYRLEGFNPGWQEVGHQHSASYTNLAPGHYTFRVRANVGDASWTGEGTAIEVVVTPPVWQTWWFRVLAAGAAAFALYRFARFQQQRRLEIALGQQALRDPLTGLANRALFRDRVEHALARLTRDGPPAPGEGGQIAVLFLDLDDFKSVNDSFGHHAGDGLLRAVSARLLNATRGCDTVARLGGDEFAVLIENARGAADAHAVSERIVAAMRAPVPVSDGADGATARVGVSVGIAFATPGLDTDALLRHADAAMYQAKANGKGRHSVFDPALVAAAAERLELERDLAAALGDGASGTQASGTAAFGTSSSDGSQFLVLYQPIVTLATGAVVGAEALVRWRHPTRGLVGPVQFIPLAEASGLIVELGRWVLNEACRAAAAWPAGPEGAPVGVTVNVSARQLLHPALPAHVADALAASGLPPARLTLEITETVLMQDTDATLATLHTLKALGVRLAVDDFGTGYSSLRYLQRFPVDVLKIDKTFVDGLARGPQDAALARTIVALGDLLSLRTVAEGVEHAAQREQLVAMGCELGQGYLFARPVEDGVLRGMLVGGAPGVER